MNTLDRFIIVLDTPEDSGNIGSVCRAMKTMGFHRLSLVGHKEADPQRIRYMAVHAVDVYEKAELYTHLEDALASASLSVGFTRRLGKRRKSFTLLPEELPEKIENYPAGDIALVFGNERTGLTRSQLALCNLSCTIPSSDEFPSLNLSHAVQIITYMLFKRQSSFKNYRACSRKQVDELVETLSSYWGDMGFFTYHDGEELRRFWEDLFCRAGIQQREAGYIEQFFRKVHDLTLQKRIDKPGTAP